MPNMKPFINKLLAVVCVCCALPLCAEDKTSAPAVAPKDYPACFSAWDNKLTTLRTRFNQMTEYDGTLISQSRGQITYAKDGPKLRLDNLEGEAVSQSALTDKKQIYILDERGKEISKISWAAWLNGQPNQALFDFGNYTELLAKHTFTIQEKNAEQAVLKLSPKTPEENYTLYITVRADNCFPKQISIESDLMKTTAVLSNSQLNQTLPTDIFKGLK